MKVEIPGEGEIILETDALGRIVEKNIPMPEVGEYIYTIKEIETKEGYKLLEDEIKMKVKFEEVEVIEEIEEEVEKEDGTTETITYEVTSIKEQITKVELEGAEGEIIVESSAMEEAGEGEETEGETAT